MYLERKFIPHPSPLFTTPNRYNHQTMSKSLIQFNVIKYPRIVIIENLLKLKNTHQTHLNKFHMLKAQIKFGWILFFGFLWPVAEFHIFSTGWEEDLLNPKRKLWPILAIVSNANIFSIISLWLWELSIINYFFHAYNTRCASFFFCLLLIDCGLLCPQTIISI